MKPRDSKWGGRGAAGRTLGSPASIGRVPKIGLSHTDERSRLQAPNDTLGSIIQENRRIITVWSLGLVSIAMLVLLMILGSWMMKQSIHDTVSLSQTSPEKNGATSSSSSSSSSIRHKAPTENEALDMVRKAFAIRDPRMLMNHFHMGGNSPESILGLLRAIMMNPDDVHFSWLGSMNANGLQIEAVAVHLHQGETPRRRLALLTPDESGVWKIDFDALAETTTPGWSAWREPGPVAGTMRVGFMEEFYYNQPYQDESEWACYAIYATDAGETFFAYCKRGSNQHRAMEEIRNRYEASLPLTKKQIHVPRAVIAVSRSEANHIRQLEITQVLAEGWITSSIPFDTSR